MNKESPLFILAGNGPYENRGCEAIVRGTTKILRKSFTDPRFICISHFLNDVQYKEQCFHETDCAIVHHSSSLLSKKRVIKNIWKPETWSRIIQYFFDRDKFYYADMFPYLDEARAVLSIGGDNYSLDYGVPTLFTAIDDIVLERKKPLVIWGASIGPFSAIPEYERFMIDHLQKVTGIFARESASIEYLRNIGVSENVYPVADPAFLMDPVQPEVYTPIVEGAIGLNFSPLMGKFVTSGNIEKWVAMAASIIGEVARKTEMQVYLIPHVTNSGSNDYTFMQSALSLIPERKENITLVSPHYTAAEIKWLIGQMALFAGARTHATIAALSSGVPTLSFAYSIKAKGINRDIFGHTDYCMDPKDLNAKKVTDQINCMLGQESSIKKNLHDRIPVIQRSAMHAGKELKRLIGEN
ncbi:MAG: polysaccharide pyruvyl transferase family protein [Methanomicrobiales archaeon HGW-Methanomicrobiales-1]|jgi:polysaccharide pyruvyl transferase WcaK-like protein|nr:MAG: polysaccharide pyruvyl transferase family protein [Methanomicrobiales archaeon HGW-Methanomicrobiales-1]